MTSLFGPVNPYLGGLNTNAPPDQEECPCVDGEDCPAHGPFCEPCDGSGLLPSAEDSSTIECPTCKGRGHIALEPELEKLPSGYTAPIHAEDFGPIKEDQDDIPF